MKYDGWTDEQYGLHFDVMRSIRYHDRRKSFFMFLHRMTNALVIMMSGAVVFQIAHEGSHDPAWLSAVAIIAAVLTAIDLVIGYSSAIALHDGLKRKFIDLQISMLNAFPKIGISEFLNRRILIESDEPPIYRALDLLCRNQLVTAEGNKGDELAEKLVRVGLIQQLTCHLCRWNNSPVQSVFR